MKRIYLACLGLFLTAYCGALLYLTPPVLEDGSLNRGFMTIMSKMVPTFSDSSKKLMSERDIAAHHGDDAASTSGKSGSIELAKSPAEKKSPIILTAETRQQIRELSVTAASAEEAGDRAIAIRQLNGVSTPDALIALQQVIRTDQLPRNRLLAVSSARQLGLRGDADGTIRALLHEASSDSDENVAINARDALQEIEQLLGDKS